MTIEKDIRLHRLMNDDLEYDVFRSEICHMYHFDGDYNFIRKVMKSNLVLYFWKKGDTVKSLYTLAMIDYISWKNNVPLFKDYENIREQKLINILYPFEVVIMDNINGNNNYKTRAKEECKKDLCGSFFYRHNIIERNIEDVV